MKTKPHPMTDDQLDQLLATTGQLQVPDDFERRVMQEIASLPETTTDTQPTNHWWWQLAGLLGAGIPGIAQTISFIFSIWNVTSAG